MTLKVGIIGICGFGREHAVAFKRLGCDIAAVADVSDELKARAEEFSATPYVDYRELLEHEGLEAISVSLPPRLHPQAIRACAAKGLPVFCEKPVAPSYREAERLLAELGTSTIVAVGFCLRYHPVYRRIRELIQSGEIGRIHVIKARKCWRANRSWRLEEGGGAVFIKDIHYYDLIPWLLNDRPFKIYAIGGSFYHNSPVEDSYQLLMSFRGGASFHLDSAWWTLPDSINDFEVIGEKARLIVTGDRLHVTGRHPRVEQPQGEHMVVSELRVFIGWLRQRGAPPPGLAEAVEASRYAQDVVDQLRSAPPDPVSRSGLAGQNSADPAGASLEES